MLTDTGYVSDHGRNCREYGRLPHRVQPRCGDFASRILRLASQTANPVGSGHLSNEDGAEAMIRAMGNRTKKIYLGHLSKENNIKELAHMTMVNQLAQADLGVGVDFKGL